MGGGGEIGGVGGEQEEKRGQEQDVGENSVKAEHCSERDKVAEKMCWFLAEATRCGVHTCVFHLPPT